MRCERCHTVFVGDVPLCSACEAKAISAKNTEEFEKAVQRVVVHWVVFAVLRMALTVALLVWMYAWLVVWNLLWGAVVLALPTVVLVLTLLLGAREWWLWRGYHHRVCNGDTVGVIRELLDAPKGLYGANANGAWEYYFFKRILGIYFDITIDSEYDALCGNRTALEQIANLGERIS